MFVAHIYIEHITDNFVPSLYALRDVYVLQILMFDI